MITIRRPATCWQKYWHPRAGIAVPALRDQATSMSTRKQRCPGDERRGCDTVVSSTQPGGRRRSITISPSGPRSATCHLRGRCADAGDTPRRSKLDMKTVQAGHREGRRRRCDPSPPRPSTLDPVAGADQRRWLEWLEEPRLTARRIRRLLLPWAGPVRARTARCYVAALRAAGRLHIRPSYHRNMRPGIHLMWSSTLMDELRGLRPIRSVSCLRRERVVLDIICYRGIEPVEDVLGELTRRALDPSWGDRRQLQSVDKLASRRSLRTWTSVDFTSA